MIMFDGIVMYIIDMFVQVILISNNMIPESILPNTAGSGFMLESVFLRE